MIKVLALDLGASSGRLMLASFDGEAIKLEEIHRFSNGPVNINGTLYWDFLKLVNESYKGLSKLKGEDIYSIGVDTWGVDFGLIDEYGQLYSNPVHYRDKRSQGMLEKAFKAIDKNELYEKTGVQIMEINTAFQLLSLKEKYPKTLENTDCLLFMPDLFNYIYSGKKYAEYSIASTSQLLNVHTKKWDKSVFDSLGLNVNMMPEVIYPGQEIGKLRKEICDSLGIKPFKVISVCGHDTQSAMLATPSTSNDFIFISCGTWSLVGTELEKPIVDNNAKLYNLTNEGAFNNRISFLKNLTGLWILQECKAQWNEAYPDLGYGEITKLAMEAEDINSFIDTDNEAFASPGNMLEKINQFCKESNQALPKDIGQTAIIILQSLAFKYKQAIEEIESCSNKKYNCIHMLGGGSKNSVLCQFTANACQKELIAGPVEATALGNALAQLISSSAIRDVKHARQIVANSEELKNYKPESLELWQEKYTLYKKIFK